MCGLLGFPEERSMATKRLGIASCFIPRVINWLLQERNKCVHFVYAESFTSLPPTPTASHCHWLLGS